MGKIYEEIDENLKAWIGQHPMWFVATAPLSAQGHVNMSPRGLDSFSILGPNRVAWVDFTGSGVETIAHLRENGRICLMFNSFDQRPRIVRLHGHGTVHVPGDQIFDEVVALHPKNLGTRAVIEVEVTRISDSCGWGVPQMELTGERDTMDLWAQKKGEAGLNEYRGQKNSLSIDGLPGLDSPM